MPGSACRARRRTTRRRACRVAPGPDRTGRRHRRGRMLPPCSSVPASMTSTVSPPDAGAAPAWRRPPYPGRSAHPSTARVPSRDVRRRRRFVLERLGQIVDDRGDRRGHRLGPGRLEHAALPVLVGEQQGRQDDAVEQLLQRLLLQQVLGELLGLVRSRRPAGAGRTSPPAPAPAGRPGAPRRTAAAARAGRARPGRR